MGKENESNWGNGNWYKVREQREPSMVDEPDPEKLRKEIEPWLTALFQSEHLSLMLGSGISCATHQLAQWGSDADMDEMQFSVFQEEISQASKDSAKRSGRGDEPNIEDRIRVCSELITGLEIYTCVHDSGKKEICKDLEKLKEELDEVLKEFANAVLRCERNIVRSQEPEEAAEYLMSFLISFASRSATRERLNIYTTNYDRIIEYGSELAGIRLIDRFVGTVNPVFRSSRVDVDMHYNPPGIRGEPRYLEGVVYFAKLHGSLDWVFRDGVVFRAALPYGAENISDYVDEDSSLLIYPNAAKDSETAQYPYVELFRDFAASICRANSTVVVYGYSFGDDHINRVIADMLTIPSTHLVIISFDDKGGRIGRFYRKAKRPAQISLLIGDHFGDLKTLVNNYLPKPAIDRTTIKMADLLKARGLVVPHGDEDKADDKEKEA